MLLVLVTPSVMTTREIGKGKDSLYGFFWNTIEDLIIGNKAAMEWLRRLSEEQEKQSSACASQKSS